MRLETQPFFAVFCAALATAMLGACIACSWRETPGVGAEDPAELEAIRKKVAAQESCEADGGTPVLGFSYRVVCIADGSVLGVVDPGWPK